ncbi:hypothetical protein [Aerosakkonema funiforme]|uniref:Uncharacterized protein n=1 Tax=Aerosakkonema funiforme FACHB-1375 TaxID=2949571 RepID=A0A926ZKS6_9CYAN|nr:hypothetical protein [Aerosakkonema funiforme]MBD2184311.1 hypothetical protein [Aerosakkonema funiforme FACHB-1375]
MAARQQVSRKAPASATRTPASKKFEPRPFTSADRSQQATPEKQVSPQPEGNVLSQVQVSPRAMVQPKLISSAGKAQSAQSTARIQRDYGTNLGGPVAA